MNTITVTGASDDLIEIGGDISEEFNYDFRHIDDEDYTGDLLAFSDGTVLRILYDRKGIWRISTVLRGTATIAKVDGVEANDTFDVVTLTGEIDWVVQGKALAFAERPTKRVRTAGGK